MKSNPFQGRYLFHFHTLRTDGKLTTQDYFNWAQTKGVQSLLFLEHVRREASYDVPAFVEEIKELEQRFGIRACIGFETKLLPDGTLDISPEHSGLAEILGIAEHGFPDNVELLQSAFQRAVKRVPEQFPECSLVWVHPGLWFKKRGIERSTSKACLSMLQQAQRSGIFVEKNLRYGLLDEALLPSINKDLLVIGADAHAAADLSMWEANDYWNLYSETPIEKALP
jgi:histidinol phosphatase-like PHP family hydrolase